MFCWGRREPRRGPGPPRAPSADVHLLDVFVQVGLGRKSSALGAGGTSSRRQTPFCFRDRHVAEKEPLVLCKLLEASSGR